MNGAFTLGGKDRGGARDTRGMVLKGPFRLRSSGYIAAGLLVGAVVITAVLKANTYYIRDLVIGQIYMDKPHRVPCDKWPTPIEVQRVIDQQAQIVSQIESVNPGFVRVTINTMSCPGKADIRILYASKRDREAISSIIGDGKCFFGVPFQMRNT